jgi:hypothetical protein
MTIASRAEPNFVFMHISSVTQFGLKINATSLWTQSQWPENISDVEQLSSFQGMF